MADGVVGSKTWASSIRKKAVSTARAATVNYVELAKMLYLMEDTPIDGDRNNPPIYHLWGYTKITDFAKQELGLEPRKASYMVSIGCALTVELANADPALVERFIDLGWTKVREICRVLKADQLLKWVLQAETSTYTEIQDAVSAYKAEQDNLTLKRLEASGATLLAKDAFGPPKDINIVDMPGSAVVSGASFDAEIPISTNTETKTKVNLPLYPEVPQIEKLNPETFSFYETQHKVVKEALDKAKKISGSDKKSNNLTLICTEFLATNDFSDSSEEQKLKLLAKLEKTLDIKLVAVDKYTFEPVYGIETLKKVAETVVNAGEEVCLTYPQR